VLSRSNYQSLEWSYNEKFYYPKKCWGKKKQHKFVKSIHPWLRSESSTMYKVFECIYFDAFGMYWRTFIARNLKITAEVSHYRWKLKMHTVFQAMYYSLYQTSTYVLRFFFWIVINKYAFWLSENFVLTSSRGTLKFKRKVTTLLLICVLQKVPDTITDAF